MCDSELLSLDAGINKMIPLNRFYFKNVCLDVNSVHDNVSGILPASPWPMPVL